jgi:hypothetical protein
MVDSDTPALIFPGSMPLSMAMNFQTSGLALATTHLNIGSIKASPVIE